MSLSISNAVSAAPPTTNAPSNAPAAQNPQPVTSGPAYTVKLSAAQQVVHLKQQGQTVSQIAFSLHLTVDTVNGYLGVTNTRLTVAD